MQNSGYALDKSLKVTSLRRLDTEPQLVDDFNISLFSTALCLPDARFSLNISSQFLFNTKSDWYMAHVNAERSIGNQRPKKEKAKASFISLAF